MTVTASRPAASTSASVSAPAGSSPVTSPTRPVTKLRGTCDTLLPLPAVVDAIGKAVGERTAFVVGVPDKGIGRLAYLNCRYAVPARPGATPGIEIGISLYGSQSQAQRRMTGAIDDYTNHDATQSALTVAGHDAVLLVDGVGPGYEVPLLVVGSGQRTVAVSVTDTIAPAAQRERIMTAIATLAVQRTGG